MLAMLSNLLWASSLIASCFSCSMVNILKYFHVIAVAREKSRLVSLNTIPTGRPAPLGNGATETPPVIAVGVIRPVSITRGIVLKHFIFFQLQSH